MENPPDDNARPAIIFDLDGTVVDTLDDITDALNAVFAEFDYAPIDRRSARSLIGEGLAVLLQRASGETNEDRIRELVQRYRAIYRTNMFRRSHLYEGVPRLLDALAARGTPMCVLSNKPDEFTVPICEALLSRWPFIKFQGSLPDAPRKPDPTLALRLCGLMNRQPDEVMFIGDSDIDVQTARNAGMRSLAVTWGFRDRAQLIAAQPDAVVDRPGEVLDWLLNHDSFPAGHTKAES